MKLNPDCIRDVLLLVEETTSLDSYLDISPEELPEEFQQYSSEEIMYHIKQCELSNLLILKSWYLDGGCLIAYLTPDGHKFLSDIRKDTNWNKTKEIAKTVGSDSLDTLKQIATSVITALIQSRLGY